MPYGGTTPEQDKKIERCVKNLMAQGKEKTNAIAICKASVMGKDKEESDSIVYENVRLNFNSPIMMVEKFKSDENSLKIGGMAVPAQESRNGRTYKIEDLHAAKFGGHAYEEGRELTMGLNHSTDVTDNVGRWFPVFTDKGVEFQGVAYNTRKHPYITDMLNKKLMPYVSVEMMADLVKEGDILYAKNQDILGLDFVKVPGLPDASANIAEAFDKAMIKSSKGDEMTEKEVIMKEETEEEQSQVEEPTSEEKKVPEVVESKDDSLIEKIFQKLEEKQEKRIDELAEEVKKLKEKPQSKGVVTEKDKPEFNLTIEKKSGGFVDIYSEDKIY